MHEAVGHVNAALCAARVSPDDLQAEGFLVKRAKLVGILRADSDVSDLDSIRHKFSFEWVLSSGVDNRTTFLSMNTHDHRLSSNGALTLIHRASVENDYFQFSFDLPCKFLSTPSVDAMMSETVH